MAKEKFILVSLSEDDSKKIAQVISNDTSRKILDYLAEKEATETELAEKLQMPISTIHYNMQALIKGRLVDADEYHYSEKGREILHYKLANKYIIIAPRSTFGIREKLKKILPAALIGFFGSFMIYLYQKFSSAQFSAASMMQEAAPLAKGIAEDRVASAPMLATGALPPAQVATQSIWTNPAPWFLFGCIFTLILIVIIEYLIYRRQK